MNNFDLAVPVLSRGKHRNPRKGACFMEFASYLAGEPWSDHPACTHPLLAGVARDVNDCTTDAGRSRLAPLIPSVIGLTPDDPHVVARVTARCIQHALPVVSQERQYILAVALLVGEKHLAALDGRPLDDLEPDSLAVLEAVPVRDQVGAVLHRPGPPGYAGLRPPDRTTCRVVRGRRDLAGLRAEPGRTAVQPAHRGDRGVQGLDAGARTAARARMPVREQRVEVR